MKRMLEMYREVARGLRLFFQHVCRNLLLREPPV